MHTDRWGMEVMCGARNRRTYNAKPTLIGRRVVQYIQYWQIHFAQNYSLPMLQGGPMFKSSGLPANEVAMVETVLRPQLPIFVDLNQPRRVKENGH